MLNGYMELRPFKFWCHKVLPLVYEDSLSYYELLCKVIEYLNHTMEDVNTLGDAFEQLKEWTEHYFDTLDIQDAVDKRLDDMVESGEFGSLVEQMLVNLDHYEVTPYMYGAKGDGVTDDTNAVKMAITKGDVYLSEGTFLVKESLTLPIGRKIRGDGYKSILLGSGLTDSFVKMNTGSTLDGVVIDGNYTTGTTTGNNSCYVNEVTNVKIKDCKIINGGFRCLTIRNSEDVLVSNCEFYGAKGSGGLGINGGVNHLSNTVIENCVSHDNALDNFISSDGNVSFVNCLAYSAGVSGTNSAGFFLNNNAHTNTLINCRSIGNTGIGIEVAGSARDVRINGCDVEDNGSDGIEVRNAISPVITENYLYANESPTFNGQLCISNNPDSESGGIVSGNVIDGMNLTTYGIYTANCKNISGINYIRNVAVKIRSEYRNRLNADDGYYKMYAERFEFDYDGTRFATITDRGENNYTEIASNKPMSLQSSVPGEGLLRLRHRNVMINSASAEPINGDFYYGADGIHVYVNGAWKVAPFAE